MSDANKTVRLANGLELPAAQYEQARALLSQYRKSQPTQLVLLRAICFGEFAGREKEAIGCSTKA